MLATASGRTTCVRAMLQPSVNNGVEQTSKVETATLACWSEAIQLPKCTARISPASASRNSVAWSDTM